MCKDKHLLHVHMYSWYIMKHNLHVIYVDIKTTDIKTTKGSNTFMYFV